MLGPLGEGRHAKVPHRIGMGSRMSWKEGVGRAGHDPATYGLKVRSSTN